MIRALIIMLSLSACSHQGVTYAETGFSLPVVWHGQPEPNPPTVVVE